MFTKKKVVPTTVAEALAPFKEVKDNLGHVITKHSERQRVAEKRIADAKAYAAQVETDESSAHRDARIEVDVANRVMERINQILGEDDQPVTLTHSTSERARRITSAREADADLQAQTEPTQD